MHRFLLRLGWLLTLLAVPALLSAQTLELPAEAVERPRLEELPQAPDAERQRLAALLLRHRMAMKETAALFETQTMHVEMNDSTDGGVSEVSLHWQDGMFREEYLWLDIHEAFGFDGAMHWYGCDLNLPYALGAHYDPDVSMQYALSFHYLTSGQRQYLSLPGDAPLFFSEQYEAVLYSPPGMGEALLLIDPQTLLLAGVLCGNQRLLKDSIVFRLTELSGWQDFGGCHFPAQQRIVNLSEDGTVQRERLVQTIAVSAVEPLPLEHFKISSAPSVPRPVLPTSPFEVPFSLVDSNVVLPCETDDGKKLRLELDTGANVGLLRRKEAERIGLALEGRERVTGHGGSAFVQYGRVEKVILKGRSGEVELPAWPAAVLLEEGGLDASLEKNDVSGLLGNFFLNYFVVRLDYRRRMMTLYEPESFNPEAELAAGYHAIPVTRDSMPHAEVQVDGRIRGGVFFNTGAQQFFTLAVWAIDDAEMLYEVESIGSGVTVAGSKAFFTIRPDLVELGDIRIEKPDTHMELLAPGEAPNRSRIASFGSSFFEEYTVTFDLFHEVFYIEGN